MLTELYMARKIVQALSRTRSMPGADSPMVQMVVNGMGKEELMAEYPKALKILGKE